MTKAQTNLAAIGVVSLAFFLGLCVGLGFAQRPQAVPVKQHAPVDWLPAETILKACRDGTAERYEERWLTVRGRITSKESDEFFHALSISDGADELHFGFSKSDVSQVTNADVGSVLQLRGYCAAVTETSTGLALDITASRVEDVIKKH